MIAATAVLLAALAGAPQGDLLTTAEKGGFERTGRYDEVVRLCFAFERAFPGAHAASNTAGRPSEGPCLPWP